MKPSKTLKEKWYRVLREKGFNDIETENSAREMLKEWSISLQHQYTVQEFKDRQEYYRLAEHFATLHKFENRADKRVWTLHAQGYPMRKISVATHLSVGTVHSRIKWYKKIMLK